MINSCGVVILRRLAKYGDAELGSAGVSPAVARASCPRACWGGTPQQLRPGRPRYIKQCHRILQASVRPERKRGVAMPPADFLSNRPRRRTRHMTVALGACLVVAAAVAAAQTAGHEQARPIDDVLQRIFRTPEFAGKFFGPARWV